MNTTWRSNFCTDNPWSDRNIFFTVSFYRDFIMLLDWKKHNNCRKKCLRCRISSFIICLEWRLALLKIFSKDLSCDIVFFILGGKPLKNETEGHGLIVKLKGSNSTQLGMRTLHLDPMEDPTVVSRTLFDPLKVLVNIW